MERNRLWAALAELPFRRAFGPSVLLLAIAAQAALYEGGFRPIPTIASGYAVSTALGLLHGEGLTVVPAEAEDVRRGVGRWDDLRALHRAGEARGPADEPLPAVSLLFAALAMVTGGLRLGVVVYAQIVLHGLGAWWLAAELRHRSAVAAVCAGAGWALFLPEYRSTLTPGYDSLPSLVYIAATVALLRWSRLGGAATLLAAGAACGAGLWVRDYLFVLPFVLAAGLAALRRPSFAGIAAPIAALAGIAAFAAPIAVLALASARAPETGATHRMIRGGVWHTFWAGVGQFENDRGLVAEDESVRDFAGRLAPDEDFRVPNYQYLAAYDRVLGEEGRRFVAEEAPRLFRNAVYRAGWLLFPSFAPSKQIAAGAGRWILVGAGVPISFAALAGVWLLGRRDPFAAWVLLAPVLSLLPLAPFYFIAKVPIGAFFVQLAFAGVALERALAGAQRPAPERIESASA